MAEEFVPIENLLLPDTEEVKELATLRGKEVQYEPILGPLEFSIALYYLENPKTTDQEIKKSLKKFQETRSGVLEEENTLESCLKWAASMALQKTQFTNHEFLLAIQYIIDSIDNRSWVPDKRAYLNWIANFFRLFDKETKKQFDMFYDMLSKQVGTNKNMLTGGIAVGGKLKLKNAGENSWHFHLPSSWNDISTLVYDALELISSNNKKQVQEGMATLVAATEMTKDHPLALSELGFLLFQTGAKKEGLGLIEKVMADGRKLFPKKFELGKNFLEWGWLENRPFLRCLHWLGIYHFDRKEYEKATEIFEEMIKLNPNDNQGIREMLVKCYFLSNNPQKVLDLCNDYKDDGSPGLEYGKPLALLQLSKLEDARKELKRAVNFSPLVAKEIINPSKNKPKGSMDGYITAGSLDEAWEYGQLFDSHWIETEGAIELLKEIANRQR